MTTFLNLVATEPEAARLPIMVDSSRFSALEAGLKCLQGKGIVNSISLKEGHEAFLEQARTIRRYGAGGRRHGLRRAGPGGDRRAQGRDPRPRVRPPHRGGRASRRRTSSSTRTCSRSRPASRSTRASRRPSSTAIPLLEERCPGALVSGGISNLSFAFRGNDAVREAMHASFLYHAIRAGLDLGIVNAGQLAVYEDIEPELLERVEDVLFDRRPDATERLVEHAARSRAGRRSGSSTSPGARRRSRSGSRTRSCTGSSTSSRRTRRRRGRRRPPARRHRGPAHGRDEDRRRPLRLGEDVPAAGREERAGDEARRRVPGAVHGGREDEPLGGRPRPARDRQGRRARHRQEHRRRRPRLQRVRGRRPGGHGPGRPHPRHRARGRVRHRRPLGADHALARRDGARREGDGPARARPPAPDRRGDDLEAAHRGADRAGVLLADGVRPRRLARRRRRRRPPRRRAPRAARRREPGRPGAAARALRRARAASRCSRSSTPARTGRRSSGTRRTSRRLRSPARASSSPTSRRCATTSTGRSSSTPGS